MDGKCCDTHLSASRSLMGFGWRPAGQAGVSASTPTKGHPGVILWFFSAALLRWKLSPPLEKLLSGGERDRLALRDEICFCSFLRPNLQPTMTEALTRRPVSVCLRLRLAAMSDRVQLLSAKVVFKAHLCIKRVPF